MFLYLFFFVFLQADKRSYIMAKKTYPNNEESTPKVAEPSIAYGRDLEHREGPFSSDAASRDNLEESDRMSVDEYFDEVWSMVLKKHDGL